MTKEQYIESLKNNNYSFVLYEYYKEKFSEKKYDTFLPLNQFIHFIQMFDYINVGMERVSKYYEEKFNIVRTFNKEGQLIAII